MDKSELMRLKELAEKATQVLKEENDLAEPIAILGPKGYVKFAFAATPGVVLELIAEIERLEKEADWLADAAEIDRLQNRGMK